MQLSDFSFDLPEQLIANFPTEQRSQSRLLCLNASNGEIQHRRFNQLLDLLRADDLLVFNNTRVIPARLYGRKESGGRVELLIERVMEANRVLAQMRASKSPRPGTSLIFEDEKNSALAPVYAEVLSKEDGFYVIQFPSEVDFQALLKRLGHMPLPPYIKRADQVLDAERYQTVYAQREGAVAAPTAGLHFDKQMLAAIDALGIDTAYLTLHIGAGTFQPVRVDNIVEHRMHKELVALSESVCDKVAACKARGGRVIAVGTTSVRSLESAAVSSDGQGVLQPFHGETDIFIYPGYHFQIVDAMITNFHLPESTLLMLVSAFTETGLLLDAYQAAIEQKYRFFSYGDAMFIYHS